jgi:hypothetical protein
MSVYRDGHSRNQPLVHFDFWKPERETFGSQKKSAKKIEGVTNNAEELRELYPEVT